MFTYVLLTDAISTTLYEVRYMNYAIWTTLYELRYMNYAVWTTLYELRVSPYVFQSVVNYNYRGADKSLARRTSRCILFDG